METPQVTILIPNYKTLYLTQLCLRLIRKYTNEHLAKVIVIDNQSEDESLAYLKSLKWIQLLERQAIPGETPVQAHAQALDLALKKVETSYVLSMHTDSLVKNKNWLPFLLSQINKRPTIAGVGSWKLESKPWWRRFFKVTERYLQLGYYRLLGQTEHGLEGIGKNYYYLRSHCALYRTDLLKKYQLNFGSGDRVAGKEIHKRLLEAGFEMVFLPSDILIRYLEHINHATTVLNPSLSTRQKSVNKGLKRIQQSLQRFNANRILLDTTLDQ